MQTRRIIESWAFRIDKMLKVGWGDERVIETRSGMTQYDRTWFKEASFPDVVDPPSGCGGFPDPGDVAAAPDDDAEL